MRKAVLVVAMVLCATLLPGGVAGSVAGSPGSGGASPGAPGIGDPYFPLDGNGGYDARHYGLAIRYNPATAQLHGVATIRATATQTLSAFNLDLLGLTVRAITVDGRPASWTRAGQELTITPAAALKSGKGFVTVVRYDGIPITLEDAFGPSAFRHTDDGAMVTGEPDVAATWYPVNDHPSDPAAYTFQVTVPRGVEATANGVLKDRRDHDGLTTWTWDAKEPMASYLATTTIGQFDLRSYTRDGIPYVDAIDRDLYTPTALPRTGKRYAFSQQADVSYQRLTRTVQVPSSGARLSFWMARDTEQDWDFAFVEARTSGGTDWTTLPDLNGHTTDSTGFSCPWWLGIHPFLEHYQGLGDGFCTATGSTGQWWAASGASGGYEQWSVDLSRFAGRRAEVSISYASDDIFQSSGVHVDDIVVSTGAGTTSFENDGNTLDGWRVSGPPADSPGNQADWMIGTAAQAPSIGKLVRGSLDRQPEYLGFLARTFGTYPFSTSGGVVDDVDTFAALENQTRPVYGKGYFHDRTDAEYVVLHELAHQWLGDDVHLKRWRDIWLNEGFATYANWLWDEDQGVLTAQESSDQCGGHPGRLPLLGRGDRGPGRGR